MRIIVTPIGRRELKKSNSDIVLTNYEIFDETKQLIIKNEVLFF